uniref:Uncharacterized protein n=1 Tax=Acrobeloides nanus TaxID=290746 RepID=A0A914DFL6_9BILA
MNRLKLIFLLFYVCLVFIEAGVNPKPNNPSPIQQACPNNMFKCKSGRCIPQSWKCDGDSDCDDGSDEDECSKHESRCNPQEYECKGSTVGQNGYIFHLTQSASLFHHNCIPTSWKCDGEFDCPNKDDEENCGNFTCGNDQFKCTSNQDGNFASCIPNSWKCDGQADCANGEDEKDCKNEHKEYADVTNVDVKEADIDVTEVDVTDTGVTGDYVAKGTFNPE